MIVTLFLLASGNDNTERPGYPAAYPEVLAVAATDSIRSGRNTPTTAIISMWALPGPILQARFLGINMRLYPEPPWPALMRPPWRVSFDPLTLT